VSKDIAFIRSGRFKVIKETWGRGFSTFTNGIFSPCWT
jgi:hypothetical protein